MNDIVNKKEKIIDLVASLGLVQANYLRIVTSYLDEMYPDLNMINGEDITANWAMDLLDSESRTDAEKTFQIIENVLEKHRTKDSANNDSIKVKELTKYIAELENKIRVLELRNRGA